MPSVVLFFDVARRVAEDKRRCLLGAAWVGGLGAAAAFVLYLPICANFEAPVLFFLGVPLLATVLGLMNLSGFTPK